MENPNFSIFDSVEEITGYLLIFRVNLPNTDIIFRNLKIIRGAVRFPLRNHVSDQSQPTEKSSLVLLHSILRNLILPKLTGMLILQIIRKLYRILSNQF